MKTAIFVVLVLLMVVSPVVAEMYEWVDESGVVNVTDNPEHIPAKYKAKAKKLEITLPEEPKKAPEIIPQAAPRRTVKNSDRGEPLYNGFPLSWWKSAYDGRKAALDKLRSDLEKLKEEQNVAKRKKMIYQRGSDKRALNFSNYQISVQEERIKAAEQSLAEFESNAEQAGLPFNWRE